MAKLNSLWRQIAKFGRRGHSGVNICEGQGVSDGATESYWTSHNVTLHRQFKSAEESLAYFRWRNDQYYPYLELMPVNGQDGKVVLDYGCGPGNDLVGFGVFSRPSRLIGMDVSASSLDEARERMKLHGFNVDLLKLDVNVKGVPLDDASVDYVHSSGVLHHVPDPPHILRELYRVLRPGGRARIMVYNYDSLWLHLYVAYQKQLVDQEYSGLDVRSAFAKSTDGENCPIANVYRPEEFIALCENAGFAAKCTGVAVSVFEAEFAARRFEAIRDDRLAEEHRKFLLALTFDERGYPLFQGRYAGVDGCYLLEKDAR